jgi:hypothetical protein
MSLFSKIKRKAGITATDKLLSKEAEYALHEKVGKDLEREEKNLGVWTKAIAIAEGDEQKVKAKYIELMVQHLKDEIAAGAELAEILEEEHEKEARMAPVASVARERKEAQEEEARRRLKLEFESGVRPTRGSKKVRMEMKAKGYILGEPLLGGFKVTTPSGERLKFANVIELEVFWEMHR